ncbi:hypothetical protein GM658_05505 [Pseudoduganella eburnea]|uniref:Ankyrin repeat domain-containing protein n=1 Tax=Massilia eburnea TaxID=1776165 RepID=A0A6L6QD77_9BURK|nr:hypothetical protein [Massilia eburnea]MTW10051.1 hypothetical protein [Massilia eburnea]
MNADRPNHNMTHLADAAIDIAANQSRLAAVRFLFDRGCTPEMIAHILASCATGRCPATKHSPRLPQLRIDEGAQASCVDA